MYRRTLNLDLVYANAILASVDNKTASKQPQSSLIVAAKRKFCMKFDRGHRLTLLVYAKIQSRDFTPLL